MIEVYKLNLIPQAFLHYSDDAEFLDPLGNCKGRVEIQSEKVALRRIVSTTCNKWELIQVLISFQVTVINSQKAEPSYSKDLIKLNTLIRYQLKGTQKDRTLNIALYLWIKDNKIVRHEDRFNDVKPTTKNEKMVVGTFLDIFRRANGKFYKLVLGRTNVHNRAPQVV